MRKIVCAVCFVLFAFVCNAQDLGGTWALDSVQVKETSIDGLVEKTILSNEQWRFDEFWMKEFTINEKEKTITAVLMDRGTYTSSYSIMGDGKYVVNFLGGVQVYSIQKLLSGIVLEDEYNGVYKSKPINGVRKYYYSKIK